MKKLKIRFVKFEKSLVMQVLEISGGIKSIENDKVESILSSELRDCGLRCSQIRNDDEYSILIPGILFESNEERDKYIDKVIHSISEELFSEDDSDIKIGDTCKIGYVSEDFTSQTYIGKVIEILPEKYENRYIIESESHEDGWVSGNFIRKVGRTISFTFEGTPADGVYTWES